MGAVFFPRFLCRVWIICLDGSNQMGLLGVLEQNELTPEYVDFIPPVSDMKEGVLYISKVFKTTAHLCACGCGNVVVLPFGRSDGMFWALTERLSGVTIRPSVGSFNLPCKSHYYITDNKVEWL